MSAYRRILVAVDGSAAAGKGLREALRLAKEERAQLFILHVVNEYYAFASMDAAPPPVDIVPEARKQQADLIVLGTHGRRGVRRLVLGSDAEQVVRSASVPVLLVRGA